MKIPKAFGAFAAWVLSIPVRSIGWLRLPPEKPKRTQAMTLRDECGETDLANCFQCVAFNGQTCPGAPHPPDDASMRKA